ncbi:MAG: rhamnan synthesis F family protein [Lachnoclostridium sp.]|nr:rhamnan synthesis F family protein [Lachnoclostridium sp.]
MDYELGEEVFFLLREIKTVVNELVVVSAKILSKSERDRICGYADKVYENIAGFDVNRWQFAIKREDIQNKEVVLFNDSFFGPLYPLNFIFEDMQTKEIDFWGFSSAADIRHKGHKFLQTYFMVFKRQVVQRLVFHEFWSKLPNIHNLNEYKRFVEYKMTYDFEKAGMTWCAYLDTKETDKKRLNNMDSMLLSPEKVMREKMIPIISKHSFIARREVVLNYNNGSEIKEAIDFIKRNTGYNEQLIYQYFIKRCNIYDLRTIFNQCFVLAEETYEIGKKRVAIYAHLFYEDLFEKAIKYLGVIPTEIDVYISTDTDEKKEKIESLFYKHRKVKIVVVNPRGREWSAFLIVMKKYLLKYDYFCMLHDKKSSQIFFETVGITYGNILWDNLLWKEGYVRAVIHFFEEHPEMGVLVPPEAYHGIYFNTAIDYWTICFEKTKELAERLALNVLLEAEKPPISLGGAFWCRTDSIRKILNFEFKYEDFVKEPMPVDGTFNHALERILPYVAQDAGFYTGTIMNPEYAAEDITNKQYIIRSILREIKDMGGISLTTFEEALDNLKYLQKKGKIQRKRRRKENAKQNRDFPISR